MGLYSWRGLNAWERKLGLELLLWTEGTTALTPYGGPHIHRPALSCMYPLEVLKTWGNDATHQSAVQPYASRLSEVSIDAPAQEESAAAWRRHSGSASICSHWA